MVSGGRDPFSACKGLSGSDAEYCRWLIEQCSDQKKAREERGTGTHTDQYRLITCSGEELTFPSYDVCEGTSQLFAPLSRKCPRVWGTVPISYENAIRMVKGQAMVIVADPADPHLAEQVSSLRSQYRDHKFFLVDNADLGAYATLATLKVDKDLAGSVINKGRLAALAFDGGSFKGQAIPGVTAISFENATEKIRGQDKVIVIVAHPSDPHLEDHVQDLKAHHPGRNLFMVDNADFGAYATLSMLQVDKEFAARIISENRFASLEFKEGSFVGEVGPTGFLRLTRDNVEQVEQEIEARGYPFMVVVGKEDSLHCSRFKDDLLKAQRSGDWTYHRLVYVDMANRNLGVDLLRQLKILDHAAEYKRIPQAYVFKGQLKTEVPRDGMSSYMESLKNRIGTIVWEAEKRELEQETKVLAAEMEVYICNVVKCRPPKNRDPKTDEIEACLPFLKKQLEVINPRIICTLGNCAARSLLAIDEPISRVRGKIFEQYNAKVIPTYHPASLLRNPQWKRPVWEDMQLIQKLLEENR